jgi:hypothetical protein
MIQGRTRSIRGINKASTQGCTSNKLSTNKLSFRDNIPNKALTSNTRASIQRCIPSSIMSNRCNIHRKAGCPSNLHTIEHRHGENLHKPP